MPGPRALDSEATPESPGHDEGARAPSASPPDPARHKADGRSPPHRGGPVSRPPRTRPAVQRTAAARGALPDPLAHRPAARAHARHDPVAGPAGGLGRLAAGPRGADGAQRAGARVASDGGRPGLPRHAADGTDGPARDRRRHRDRSCRGHPASRHLPVRDGARRDIRPDLHERGPGRGRRPRGGQPAHAAAGRADQRPARRDRHARPAADGPDRHDDGRLDRPGRPHRLARVGATRPHRHAARRRQRLRPEAQLAAGLRGQSPEGIPQGRDAHAAGRASGRCSRSRSTTTLSSTSAASSRSSMRSAASTSSHRATSRTRSTTATAPAA